MKRKRETNYYGTSQLEGKRNKQSYKRETNIEIEAHVALIGSGVPIAELDFENCMIVNCLSFYVSDTLSYIDDDRALSFACSLPRSLVLF